MKVTYTLEQRIFAVETFRSLGSYTKTVRKLGYPSLHVLHAWVRDGVERKPPSRPAGPPRRYGWELKRRAVELVLSGRDIREVAEELSITSHAIIYNWIRIWRLEGDEGLMTKNEKADSGHFKTKAQLEKALPDDVEELKRIASKLMAEKAVLEKELELVKKDEGVIPGKLSAKNKTRIVDSLRGELPLALLLEAASIRASTYYSARASLAKPDKYAQVRIEIREISDLSARTYGSPRIWACLRRRGIRISEKVVRRLMKEESVEVRYARRRKKYSSYIGEVTPAPKDLVRRKFRAEEPNRLWLTDITEFSASDGKVYLSPIIDCYDGMVAAWRTSRHPDNALVEGMLDDAIEYLGHEHVERLKRGETSLVVHSDRGGHYRGGRWIERLESLGISRSMSRKGKSGDNAACEGFFGRMKTEMYYGRRWQRMSELEDAIADYLSFYNNERIKMSLGGLSIAENRTLRFGFI